MHGNGKCSYDTGRIDLGKLKYMTAPTGRPIE
jgi:hypothetical protein